MAGSLTGPPLTRVYANLDAILENLKNYEGLGTSFECSCYTDPLALEHLTVLRVKAGLLPDDIADQLVAKHVCVVSDRRLTPKAQAFTNAHYVSVAWRLKVLGHPLQPVRNGSEITYPFEIVIPETYAFVDPHGLVEGELDGQPLSGPVFLRSGSHAFRCRREVGPLAYEWFHAFECGFSPFTDLPSQAKCPGD